MRSLLLLSLLTAAACGTQPISVGSQCDPVTDADACDDGLSCGFVAVHGSDDVDVCTRRCEVPGPETDLPSDIPPQCPIDGVCVAVPSGFNECLALCADDGSCAYGEPGAPFADRPEVCVCIPWRPL